MNKKLIMMTAVTMAFSMMITGCSLNKDDSKEATEYINDETLNSSDDSAGLASSSNIIVADDLATPDFEDYTTAAASTEASQEATEESKEEDKVVMVFFGDSQIANGRNDGTDIPTLVQQRVPNSVAYNFAIGGTTASLESSTSNYQDYENWTSNSFVGMVHAFTGKVAKGNVLSALPDLITAMDSVNPADVDYYFIEYGANDFFAKVPLDKFNTEEHYEDIYTYYGALRLGISELREASPNARFFLISPVYGIYKDNSGNYLGDSYVVSNGFGTLSDYAKKMGNVSADEENCFLVDAMFGSRFDLYLDTADQYLMDNVHLTETGRRILARMVAHWPNGFEFNEPKAYRESDFVNIATFDPDEFYRLDDGVLMDAFPDQFELLLNGEYKLVKPNENTPQPSQENQASGENSENQENQEAQ
ncbi:SGNH/GDSL hydrolase family protein [Butyrivibrio sp. VCB2006]|uniref:SGNH/GDSL hydrolase family protein n=1 Tax=Butyrivibrio sp. VCB2006 TaxID=1280679 RepID=UPI00041E2EAD|nr:SGNH/GDSL hydrolase family protein [Butyrivibrio sp. VCB2006]